MRCLGLVLLMGLVIVLLVVAWPLALLVVLVTVIVGILKMIFPTKTVIISQAPVEMREISTKESLLRKLNQ